MTEETIWEIRLLCGLASLICLFVASIVSGLYHCVDGPDVDSCIMSRFAIAVAVSGSWCFCCLIFFGLVGVRDLLKEEGAEINGRRLGSFFCRLGLELLYMVTTTVMPVASVALFDKVPKHHQVTSCALVMASVLLLSYSFMDSENIGLCNTIESIFLSAMYLAIKHHSKNHHVGSMLIAAGILSLRRLAIFFSKEWLRWNRRRRCQILLESLRGRLGNNDPEAIALLDALQAELRTL